MSRRAYRRRVRQLVDSYLHACALPYRCTQIRIVPRLTLNGHGVWAIVHQNIAARTFWLEVAPTIPESELPTIIGHEIGHLLTTPIMLEEGNRQVQYEELACDVIGRLLAGS